MTPIRLLILDCDGTMWDHPDLSITTPPYRLVAPDHAASADGARIRLLHGLRDLIAEAARREIVLSIASWNRPEPVRELLTLFGLWGAFAHPVIEPHPHKDRMLRQIFESLARDGRPVAPDETAFVDDKARHAVSTLAAFPGLRFLQMGVDVQTPGDVFPALDAGGGVLPLDRARRRLAAGGD